MKILFAGGGTGGHLYSGIAVAHQIVAHDAGAEVVFAGTEKGIEARVIPQQTDWRLLLLKISAIKGRGPLGAIAGGFRAFGAVMNSFALLRAEKPNAVVGIGGYASGPTLLAAALAGYPTAVIEQNVIPGFTNKVLSRFVRRIYVPSEDAVKYFPGSTRRKIRVTGNPIRLELIGGETPSSDRVRLLVFGGSQGAKSLNRAMTDALPRLKSFAITHQTGRSDLDRVQQKYAEAGMEADVRAFIDDMGAAYRAADLVICRAGASTLAELTALGKPALLVPYPHAIYNHQELNARALADRGAADWIKDSELNGDTLVSRVRAMTEDPDVLKAMAGKAREAGHPQAATEIAAEVLSMARKKKSDAKTSDRTVIEDNSGSDGGSVHRKVVTHAQTPTVTKKEDGSTIVETILVRA